MEARELIIGNIYSLSLDNGVPEERALDSHDLFHILEHGKEDKVSPIPLTEEFLERLGFKKIGDWKKVYLNYYSAEFYLNEDEQPVVGLINGRYYYILSIHETYTGGLDDTSIELEYIHQLQNIYFALKGTELTIK